MDDLEDELPPAKTKAGAKKPLPPLEDEDDEEEFTPPTKGKTPPKKGAALFDDDDEEDAPPPKPKAGPLTKKGAPSKDDFGFGDDDDEDDLPPVSAKGKKAPPPKKGKARDDEEDDLDDEDEDRPSKKGKAGKGKKKSKAMLFAIVGILLVAGLGAVAAFVYPGFWNAPTNIPGRPPGPGPGPGPVMPTGPLEDPLAYMPADAAVVIGGDGTGVRAAKIASRFVTILASKQKKTESDAPSYSKSLEDLLGSVQKALKVEKVMIGVIAPDPKTSPQTVAVFAFADAVDMDKIKPLLGKELPGKSYLQMEKGAYLANPNPKVLVIGKMLEKEFESRLPEMGKSVVLKEEWKTRIESFADAHFYLVTDKTPFVEKLVGMVRDGVKAIDPKFAPAAEVLDKFKAVTLSVRDDGGKLDLTVGAICQDEKDATQLEAAIADVAKALLSKIEVLEDKAVGLSPEVIEAIKSVVMTFKSEANQEQVSLSLSLTDDNIKTLEAFALRYFLAAEEGPVGPPIKKIDPTPSKFSFDKAPVPELQGKWKLTKLYDEFGGGKKSYIALSSPSFLTIKGNESTFETDNDGKKVVETYTLEVDASKTPKVYRQTLAAKDGGPAVLGIYSVEKDILLMADQADGMPPESLTVTKGDGKRRRLFEFERVAP